MTTSQWTKSWHVLAMAGVIFVLSIRPSPAADENMPIRGRIERIDQDNRSVTVKTADGRKVNLTVTDQSKLEMNARPATLKQFREGQRVRARVEKAGTTEKLVHLSGSAASDDDVARNARETLEAIREYGYQQQEEYASKLNDVIDDLDDRIDDLKQRAYEAKGDAKTRYAEEVERLSKKRAVLDERLAKVRSASEEAWGDVRTGVGAAAEDLRNAWDRARARFTEK